MGEELTRSGMGSWRRGGEEGGGDWGMGLSSSMLVLTRVGTASTVRLGSDAALSKDLGALSDMIEESSYIEGRRRGDGVVQK